MQFYTEDLSDFGYRELKELRDLLDQYIEKGLPSRFNDSGLKPAFNMNSGNVFFTNDEFQVAMINPNTDKLESFYTLFGTGAEGFADDLKEMYDDGDITDEDDIQQLRDLGIIKRTQAELDEEDEQAIRNAEDPNYPAPYGSTLEK